jgi:hypothetical protein
MNTPVQPAFFMQAIASFGVSVVAVGIGIAYLPLNNWTQGFLAIGVLYVITSSFTLAKCIRDRQETTTVVSRVDQARLDKLMVDHDPFKLGSTSAPSSTS